MTMRPQGNRFLVICSHLVKKASQEMNIGAEINLDMALCEFIEQRNNQNFWGRL